MLNKRIENLYLAHSGRPPRANITGPDKAASASLVTFKSEKALPHKTSDERSISAAINPLFPLDPRSITSPIPELHDQIYIYVINIDVMRSS